MGSAAGGLAVVIPARFEATRLPGKLLKVAAGRTILEWTYRRAVAAAPSQGVFIATDSNEIASVATAFGAAVIRTGPQPSGTDRVAEALAAIAPHPRWVINLQGDEPLIDPEVIAAVGAALTTRDDEIVTCAAPIERGEAWGDPSVVKVVTTSEGRALYFSRAPIPSGVGPHTFERNASLARVHIGIYGYPAALLERLVATPPTPLERAESLEQLRALELGFPIRVLPIATQGCAVDTAADLARATRLLEEEERKA